MVVEAFANRFFKSSPIIGEIYNLIKDHEHPNVINSFLDIVIETKQAETYLDYTLQKCHFIQNYSDNGSTHLVPKVYILNIFKAIESPDGLIKLFTFFSKETDYDGKQDHFFNDSLFPNTLSLLLERVKENFIEERLHQEIISCYMNSLPLFIFMPYQTQLYKTYLPFIKEHNWSDEIFTTTINNFCTNNYADIDSTAFYLSLLLDENEKVDEIRERIKDDYKCWLLLSLMSKHIDEESIKNHIETTINCHFPEYVQKQTDNSYEVIKKRDLTELLNYDSFRTNLLTFLSEESPKSISDARDYFWNRDILPKDKKNQYIADYFLYVDQNDDINKQMSSLIDNKELYTHVALKNTYSILISNDRNELLSSSQKDHVRDLAYSTLLSAINHDTIGHWIYCNSPILELLFANKLPDIEEEKLLCLLPYSHYYSSTSEDNRYLLDYLEQHIAKQKLTNKIIEYINLHKATLPKLQLVFTPYTLRNHIEEEYGTVVSWSINNPSLLHMLLENDETKSIIKSRYKEFSLNNQLLIFKHIAASDSDNIWIREELWSEWESYTTDSSNISTVLYILLLLNYVQALTYLTEHIELIPEMSNMTVRFPDSVEGIPQLVELYSAFEQYNYRPFNIQSTVLDALYKIAISSEDGFSKVEVELLKLIKNNPDKSFLLHNLKNWKKQMLENHTTPMNFQEAYEIISSVERLDSH